jgi:hypothetical protein
MHGKSSEPASTLILEGITMYKKLGAACAVVLCGIIPAFADQTECTFENKCIQDQALRIQIERVRIRGKIANLSLRLTNQTAGELTLSTYNEYLSATTFEGERLKFSTNRSTSTIVAEGERSLAYSLEFKQEVGEGFDLILTFETPDSSYAFFDLHSFP